ncbi:hypothetical protein [Caloramator proteoclasticus]|uniref:Uncharacterized protein n=1 Tax=Caloramator proteoclasticus DSM 10124 TaxID=1121262 RepID=A0A1M5BPE0_9CLOT|nr:hypothetical protein [Caloramator proteoclasticus]SHF44092.1 hypothetical protein SAMN02746091_02530 [Caloramator proteoclasticus DSM 10124]
MTRKVKDEGSKDLKDCFAYRNRRCLILNSKDCHQCPFYKTKEEFNEDRRKALHRINKLDEETRIKIIEKYYLDILNALDTVEK